MEWGRNNCHKFTVLDRFIILVICLIIFSNFSLVIFSFSLITVVHWNWKEKTFRNNGILLMDAVLLIRSKRRGWITITTRWQLIKKIKKSIPPQVVWIQFKHDHAACDHLFLTVLIFFPSRKLPWYWGTTLCCVQKTVLHRVSWWSVREPNWADVQYITLALSFTG